MKRLFKQAVYLAAAAIVLGSAVTTVFAHGPNYEAEMISKYGVRISITMKEGEQNIPVWIKDIKFGAGEDGKLAKVYYTRQAAGGSRNYIDLDSRILNLPLRINLMSADAPEEELFSDLSNKMQIEYITHLHDAGIINGYPDKTFHPAETITRAEFMVMMVKALKLEGSIADSGNFSDIDSHWAKDVLLLSVKHGLLRGYEGNLLKPDAPISVGEVSTIISKSFPLAEMTDGNFELNSQIVASHWSWPYMKKLLASGIISSTNNNQNEQANSRDITVQNGFLNTSPDTPVTRGDCAVLLSRAAISKQ